MNDLMMLAGLSAILSQALPVSADDLEAAKQKAGQVCAACHGAEGNKPFTPETPKLAGQHSDYLEHALLEYQSGARQNPLMSAVVQPLTKREIRALAQYFSELPGLKTRY